MIVVRDCRAAPVLLCPGETMQVRMKSFVLQRRAEAGNLCRCA